MRTATLSNIKRVVSVFILRQNNNDEAQVALFRRCSQMPTFGGHWAAISGSIETQDVSPLATADREVGEETNLGELLGDYDHLLNSGLHIDIAIDKSKGTFGGRMIRVYPFALTLPSEDIQLLSNIEMRGTEHDKMKFLRISDFLGMSDQCVPSLKRAFHHATSGRYLDLPQEIREWEGDRVNGAAYLARKAVDLAAAHTQSGELSEDELSTAQSIAILRPSMVPIVNAMNEFDRRVKHEGYGQIEQVKDELLKSLTDEGNRCVELGYELVMNMYKSKASSTEFVIGTFSRSSTLKSILQRIIESSDDVSAKVRVVCSQSTPGDEGILMATDITGASCLPDEEFQQQVIDGKMDVVIVGADCVLSEGNGVVNKVGSKALASVCKQAGVHIISSADRWKLWSDIHCPPLEDIFELIPSELFDHVLVPKEDEEER
mmetsp:Transcript_18646/g.28372  ORF Transcript_18646/g.28372 Transcript_18646/m.28372 type:complete len:433 (-) Transcript_18646:162-1460(-)